MTTTVSPDYWNGLHPCQLCGQPLGPTNERQRGSYWHPDVPLDGYEAINLLEALKFIPDTGDWHGQLRFRCEAVLRTYGSGGLMRPNATAEQMAPEVRRRASSLSPTETSDDA